MQVRGVHIGTSGCTQEVRSKIMNSRIFSCGVSGAALPQLPGKGVVLALAMASTWKSEKSTRPHWFAGIAPTGVLKVYSSGALAKLLPGASLSYIGSR